MTFTPNIIPLNSFTKDEIYTFLGGLLISGTWTIYFSENLTEQKQNIIFITAWLACTAALHLFNLLLTFTIMLCVNNYIAKEDNRDIDNLEKRVIGFNGFISKEKKNKLLQSLNIIYTLTTSLTVCSYPLFKLFFEKNLNINILSYYSLFSAAIIECIIISVILAKVYMPIDILQSHNKLRVYDDHTLEQETAIHLANLKKNELT